MEQTQKLSTSMLLSIAQVHQAHTVMLSVVGPSLLKVHPVDNQQKDNTSTPKPSVVFANVSGDD